MSSLRASLALAGQLASVGSLALPALPATVAAEPSPAVSARDAAADLVVTGGKIYTEDATHSTAEAIAVKNGKIVYVGSNAGVQC